MKSNDLRKRAVVAEPDPDSIAAARRLQENGDAAREHGHLLFALLQYHKAAQLRRRHAGFAGTAAACSRDAKNKRDRLRVFAQGPKVPVYVVSLIAAVAVAGAARLVAYSPRAAKSGVRTVMAVNAVAADAPNGSVHPAVLSSPAATSEPSRSGEPTIVDEKAKSVTAAPESATAPYVETRKHAKHGRHRTVTTRAKAYRVERAECDAAAIKPCQAPLPQRPTGLLQLNLG